MLHWNYVAALKLYQILLKNKVKRLDDLETGIKQLLLEDRCSFSEQEKSLLNNCLLIIQETKNNNSTELIVRVFEILAKLFISGDYFWWTI